MRESFGGLLWSSFRSVYGPVITAISLVLAFLFWMYSPQATIQLVVVAPISVFVLGILTTLGHAAYQAFLQINRVPRALVAREMTLLFESSRLFSQGLLASVYYTDDANFEALICVGEVVNVQRDGRMQIAIRATQPGQEDVIDRLLRNDVEVLRRVFAKPNVPTGYGLERVVKEEVNG